jgi:glycosyltransferase involved in cell wall biosynthesis
MFDTGRKFHQMLCLYPAFIVGSPYLARLVPPRPGRPAPRVSVVPTCIDLERYGVKSYASASPPLSFGWIGGVANLGLLDVVLPALNRLAGERPCRLVVISGRPVPSSGPLEIVNLRWSPGTEIEDLLKIDIGLMPLDDSAVSRGKCGFKLLQYMASGIVGLASAVTVNQDIVTDGVDGFLVDAGGDWEAAIRRVLAQSERFAEIGRRARERVAAAYTFEAHLDAYAAFLREVAEDGTSG